MSILSKASKVFKGEPSELNEQADSRRTVNYSKNSDDYLLALDIGTEYVKALIAKKARNTLKIVGVGKAHEAPTNMFAGAIADISGVAKTCEDALIKAEEMAGVRAREVVVGIAGELIKGTPPRSNIAVPMPTSRFLMTK